MIISDTSENSTSSTPDSIAVLTAVQHLTHVDGVPVVVVIGDGQLARMMQTEAIELGQSIRLLAGSPDASAAQMCADIIIGGYHVWEGVEHAVAGMQAVILDHERAPTEFLSKLTGMGYLVQPQSSASLYAQDKLPMRQCLEELGALVPVYAAIKSAQDAETFFDCVNGVVCPKVRRGGYDGHGVWFPKDRENLHTLVDGSLGKDVPLVAERKVALARELSVMYMRTPSEEVKAWPVLESVQRDGICVEVIYPAPGPSDELASTVEKLSVAIASELEVTGALAAELFETVDADGNPETFVNELAVRPYNTGHWSQDGCGTSQFEQHLCAATDLSLGFIRLTAPVTAMVNTLGGERASGVPIAQRLVEVWRRLLSAKIHWYGKDWRPGRKLGRVDLYGYDASPEGIAETRRIASLAAGYIVGGAWTGGNPVNDA